MELPDEYQLLDYGTDLYAPQSTLDEEGRRILTAWLRMPEPVDGKWQGMMCIPRVVEVKENHIYFRVHPNVQAAYTREISAPSEADESGYRLRFSLEDGDKGKCRRICDFQRRRTKSVLTEAAFTENFRITE